MRADLAVNFGLAGAEERRSRNELDAAADRVAPELGAVRAANHLEGAEVAGVVEVEESVDAAARRRRRKSYAVNVIDDLGAGQPTDEDGAHGRRRALQLQPRLFLRRLREDGFCALSQAASVDDVDLLRSLVERLNHADVGGDRDLGCQGFGAERDLDA